VLGRVQDRQRLAAGPVAQEQRGAEQLLPVLAAVHVHRPRDGRLDLGRCSINSIYFRRPPGAQLKPGHSRPAF
jgi:hypothetical protein